MRRLSKKEAERSAAANMPIFKPHIRAMVAYKPPLEGRNPKQHLLLDFNERTLPPSPAVVDALVDFIRDGRVQMYPSYSDITEKIAQYVSVDSNQLMITNGSDQGIDLVFRSACNKDDEAIIPGPSFAMYHQCAAIEQVRVIAPSYTQAGGYPTAAVLAAISPATRLIVVANPNNPSGTLVPREVIIELAKAAPQACILVDECYFEYSGVTVVDLVAQFTNVVVTRTFSKTWGLPSLRIGYVVSAAENIAALLNVRGPYDINQLAIVAVAAALENQGDVQSYIREVMQQSKPKLESFLRENRIEFWPSAANFIWIFPPDPEAVELALREKNILVRPKRDNQGQLGLRVTLGTLSQLEQLIGGLQRALSGTIGTHE